uniref:transposase family protein n=1 Tax=Aporhodopirellula rubra TaxID=980271 RepID=UPI001FE2B313|nr:transposase family protein [Aporhodopirellula rubra]
MSRRNALLHGLISFGNVTDPRPGEPVYPLVNVLFMMICGVVAGADDFLAIARFAITKKDWFARFLDLTHAKPKSLLRSSTKARTLAWLSKEISRCFTRGSRRSFLPTWKMTLRE